MQGVRVRVEGPQGEAWGGRKGRQAVGRSRRISAPRCPALDCFLRRRPRGQSLVEFALVLPVFIILLLGVVEFAFMFAATLSVNFATRNSSLIAAEAGNASLADCKILQQLGRSISAPQDITQVQSVTIFRATETGQPVPGVADTYTYGGSLSCPFPSGTVTLPYTSTTSTYPPTSRCNTLAGCLVNGTPSTYVPLDSIGVRVVYRYRYHTGLPGLLPFLPGSGAGYVDLTWSNVMRMEPVL